MRATAIAASVTLAGGAAGFAPATVGAAEGDAVPEAIVVPPSDDRVTC